MYLRENIDQKQNIYKIGKSKQWFKSCGKSKRCNGYPKGSIQLALYAVSNCDEAEKHLIHQLKIKDTLLHCKQKYGEEYFCGPLHDIIDIVTDTAKLYTINEVTSAETIDSLATPINDVTSAETIDSLENNLQCTYCLHQFSRRDKLKAHLKICTIKVTNDT